MRTRWLFPLALFGACGPDEHTGVTHRVDLPDEPTPSSAGEGGGGAGGQGGAGGEVVVVPPEPPEVSAMTPLTGPYGTEVRVVGSHLGSAARSGVTLTLGSDETRELEPESTPEIISWTESEIRFRFPFPLAGDVVVTTPQGSVTAGQFEPNWLPGEKLAAPAAVNAIASIAHAPGTISTVLDTGPPEVVTFDGQSAASIAIDDNTLRPESIRLYRDGSELQAFALSTATDHEIMALDPASDFAATSSGVTTAAENTLAGGREGASVWYRVANDWTRVRPSGGVWAVDKGPIADPQPSGQKHTAATASDGSLYVGWAEDTGDTLDDLGAPFFRRLVSDGTAFLAKTRAGIDVDDRVSSYVLSPRGSGVVGRYCGTDMDPLGASSDDLLCYAALVPSGVRSTVKESSNVRYAFDGIEPIAAYCSATAGLRIVDEVITGTDVSALEARAGEIVTWPCAQIVALEVDDEGDPLVVVRYGGALYSPRPRVP
ncbi:MAG TPA: hypothetical protein VM686_02740 [Polyangiaceae bacterium]|nr:hypothetical protein [Polyangiaceae bacterium]